MAANITVQSPKKRDALDGLRDFIYKHKYKLISVAAVVVLLILWELGSIFGWFNPKFIPPISSVWSAFTDTLANGYNGYSLGAHLWASMRRLLIAIAVAFIIAVPLGLLAGANKVVHAILDPFIEFYRALPPLAYYTLLVLWFGIGDMSKITLLTLNAFAPIFISTVFSVEQIPQDRINGARSLGSNGVDLFLNVIFPSCLPQILTGLRTAVGVAYATMVAAEMVAAVSGIGWLVLDASKYVRYDIVYYGIIIMGAIAILIDAVIRLIIKRVTPWTQT
ncbi:MAG: ABC transporter permease [Clostridia bacterium]|nr:ABC transporter permease [Clostridia bacterium]